MLCSRDHRTNLSLAGLGCKMQQTTTLGEKKKRKNLRDCLDCVHAEEDLPGCPDRQTSWREAEQRFMAILYFYHYAKVQFCTRRLNLKKGKKISSRFLAVSVPTLKSMSGPDKNGLTPLVYIPRVH